MTYELLIGLAIFAFVTSITPGPNNLMLMASGLNFGMRRTLPHMFGVGVGFTLMIFLIGVGLNKILESYPQLNIFLSVISFLFLLYLAYKIANAGTIKDNKTAQEDKPISFLQAAAFQWTNPKAWVMCLSATATYSSDEATILTYALIALIFGLINLPSVSVWVCLGAKLKAFFNTPFRIKAFNYTAAFLLIATMIPMLIG